MAALLAAAPAAAQPQPTAAPPQVLDGPTPAIVGPTGLDSAIARDGTGGLVYLKQVGGVAHVFVSALTGGSFGAPQQLDGGLSGPSSQPVIAAGNGGLVLVAFINGGALYVTQRTSAGGGFSAPRALAGGAADPALQMTNFGKAYLAFTVADGSGDDVRAAYYFQGAWSLEGAPLNATPGDVAGTGSARPAVAAAGDGVGIVAWGEGGHIYTRRVWGTAPSVLFEQADGPLAGCSEGAADEPAIGSGGDSSYAAVAFHETLTCGGQTQSRVLADRLHGSRYDGVYAADGLSGGGDGADAPVVAVTEYGQGWITSARTGSLNAEALVLTSNEAPVGVQQVNSLPEAADPAPVPAIAGFFSTLIAWQHDPGGAGPPEIRVRFAEAGGPLDADIVLSSAAQGHVDGAAGLTAAGDVAGEAAVAWVQNTPAGGQIVADQLYQPPSAPALQSPRGFVRTTRPMLDWSPSNALWGPRYTVWLDGAQLGQTPGTVLPVLTPLGQGPHTWQVSTGDPAGLTSNQRTGHFFVDTIAPTATLQLRGRRNAGVALKLHVIDTDTPPGLPASDGSGISRVLVRWGDHTSNAMVRWHYHVYRRPGRYRITVALVDRAGNVRHVSIAVTVHRPRKHTKAKRKKRSRHAPAAAGVGTPSGRPAAGRRR